MDVPGPAEAAQLASSLTATVESAVTKKLKKGTPGWTRLVKERGTLPLRVWVFVGQAENLIVLI